MRYLLVLACLTTATPVMAGDFDYEAEAALALASVKLTPTQAPVKVSPCEFCKVCTCNNCGCNAFHGKAGAVPAASTFPERHAGHNCPKCSFATYEVRGPGPVRGTHLHVCPKCGTTWFH